MGWKTNSTWCGRDLLRYQLAALSVMALVAFLLLLFLKHLGPAGMLPDAGQDGRECSLSAEQGSTRDQMPPASRR